MSLPRIQSKLFINNEFVDAVSGKTFPVYNPVDESVLCEVAEGDAADVDKAVEAAHQAFKSFRKSTGAFRFQIMNKLADLIDANADELALLESYDNGKPHSIAKAVDIALVATHFRYYAGWAGKVCGKTIPTDPGIVAFTRHEPVGVVGAIIPWNFPLLMAAWKIAPAISMGCTMVLKPAEQTPLTALRLAELALEAGFPPGVLNVVTGFGPTAGAAVAKHPKIDKVAFTGSVEVGRIVQELATKSNLKRVSLELGGKSPCIVANDADLDKAVEIATDGLFFNAGQTCCASSRVYVQSGIYDDFVRKAAERARGRVLGDPRHPETTLGPVVSSEQFDRVLGYIEKGKQSGARLACGGERFGSTGYFIKPTVFADVDHNSVIAREEIFGPVLSILKFETIEEAIELANDSNYGLAAAVITKDMNTAFKVIDEVRAGTVWCNCFNVLSAQLPFGGFKESGHGRDNGEYALELYTEVKCVTMAVGQ